MTTFATTVREREGGEQESTIRERVEESDDGTGGGWYDNSTNDRNGTDENIFNDPPFESPPPPPCFDYESEPPLSLVSKVTAVTPFLPQKKRNERDFTKRR